MKLFVTGATGFIGSNFVKKASKAGHTIVAQRRPQSLKHRHLPVEKWVEMELNGDFRAVLKACDAIVHFASHTPNPPYASLSECTYWNVTATMSLLEQASEVGIERFVLAGTCFEYGMSALHFDNIPPQAPLLPQLSYPTSKAAASVSAAGLAREQNLRLQILRIFQAYGDGEAETRFWPSLRKAAFNGNDFNMSAGLQIRDFIHVDDICEAFLCALSSEGPKAGRTSIQNVASGHATKLIDFAQSWWKKWEAKGNLIPGTVGLRPGELSRIVAEVGTYYEN
jgi:nucleoside-diphosphate-sugar epimerase